MTNFDFDVMQRKRLAGQARYKKNGSKSKRCTLLSDNMTNKQWKERCGGVVSYNPRLPMNWADFKKLSALSQAEYINTLQDVFGANATTLGDMFGVRPLTVRRFVEKNELDVKFQVGHSMTRLQKERWAKFLYGDFRQKPDEVEQSSTASNQCDAPLNRPDEAPSAPEATEAATLGEREAMSMSAVSLVFSGNIDINGVANSLRAIVGDGRSGKVEITCNFV